MPTMSNGLTSIPFAALNQKQPEVKGEDNLQTHEKINERWYFKSLISVFQAVDNLI